VPRSLVAVPLIDDDGTLGVLEVLDKRGEAGFDLRDVDLAMVFARQATLAIRATRVERDTETLLRVVLGRLDAPGEGQVVAGSKASPAVDVEALVREAVDELNRDDEGALWALADEIARLRTVDPGEIGLVRELLGVLVRRAERGHGRPDRGR
jgi:GAF domain-containing protein